MTATSETRPAPHRAARWVRWVRNDPLLVALIALFVLYSVIAAPYNFLSYGNIVNMLISATVLGLIACGVTMALLAGQVDLSAAGVAGLASIVAAVLFQSWAWPAPAAVAATLVVGALAGLFISVLIVEARIYSLIASLSVIGLFTGLAMTFSDNLQIPLARQDLQQLIFYRGILGLPISVWIMFLLFGLGYVMLNHTRLGAHIYATGANYTAARLSGVPVTRIIRITLMMSAVAVALAALVVTARGNITVLYGAAGPPQLQATDALVAVLLGGASLYGGAGRIERTLMAVLFLTVLQNGLTLMGAPLSAWFLARGGAFLVAVVVIGRSSPRMGHAS